MAAWAPKEDVEQAKSDDWLTTAKTSTESWLKNTFGYGNEPQAIAVPQQPVMNIKLPSAEEWHAAAPWRDLDPPKQTPTPSGTPVGMPSNAPRTGGIDSTITTGPRPDQQLRPGESVGSVTLGSAPDQQKAAYEEALASGLDEEGARILVAVTETEGGLTGNIGDQGQSRGGYQFHEGGQMPGFRAWLAQQGIQGDPNVLVNDIRLTTRYAATGYLGRAIAAGRAQGLSGAELATYVQQHGQVSVDPWKTGQNYQRLYGGAQGPAQQIAPTVPQQQQSAAPMPSSAPAQPHTGPKLRVVDEWGNEYEMTQDDLNRRPPGGGKLTVLGPVAMNAGPGSAPSGSAAPPQTAGGPSSASSLPPTVAAKWRQMYGRDPNPDEASELMSMMGVA